MAYNDKIIIQQKTEARNADGDVVKTWSTYKTVWAEVSDSGDGIDNQSEQSVYYDSKDFKIHSRDAPAVTTAMRISYDSQYFFIRGISRDGRLRKTLTATAYDDE